jgi:murein L,D-transpeptidase YcbB/YkuD
VAGGLTGGVIVAGAAVAPGAQAASADDFARLRACESGGNYQTNTGNGFYGAYQFDLGTWNGLGYSGRPSDAASSTQDAAARQLQSERGWSPWPACASRLGLGSSQHSSSFVSSSTSHAVIVDLHARPGAMSTQYAGQYRTDVRQLQGDLHLLGYTLTEDGHFGPETDGVVRDFQTAASVTVDGVAGPETLKAVHAAKFALQRNLSVERVRAI